MTTQSQAPAGPQPVGVVGRTRWAQTTVPPVAVVALFAMSGTDARARRAFDIGRRTG